MDLIVAGMYNLACFFRSVCWLVTMWSTFVNLTLNTLENRHENNENNEEEDRKKQTKTVSDDELPRQLASFEWPAFCRLTFTPLHGLYTATLG